MFYKLDTTHNIRTLLMYIIYLTDSTYKYIIFVMNFRTVLLKQTVLILNKYKELNKITY